MAVGAGRPGFLVAVRARFWDGVRSGLGVREAAAGAGVSRRQGQAWFRGGGRGAGGGAVAPGGRYLSLAEREEVAVGLAAGLGPREIGRSAGATGGR